MTTTGRNLRRVGKLLQPLAMRARQHPLLGRVLLKCVPDWPFTIELAGIGRLRMRPRRHRALWLRDPLVTERFPFRALDTLTTPGCTVFDVGANIGLYTRYLHSLRKLEHVVAFEPWPENVALLRENLRLGGVGERTTVVPAAVSDEDGTVAFQVDDMQSTSGTLDKVAGGGAAEGRRNLRLPPVSQTVPCHRLDTLVESGALPSPDLLKVDVEGAEALVLQGAELLLRRRRPAWVIELHGAAVATRVLTLLAAADYTCLGCVDHHLHPSGVGPLDPSFAPRIRGLYDVQYVVAVPRENGARLEGIA